MTLQIADDVTFTGPALPEGYVRYELEAALKGHLVRGQRSNERWADYRRQYLGEPLSLSGGIRVLNVLVRPLAGYLGYDSPERDEERVITREGREDGGYLLKHGQMRLRVWPLSFGADIDAPSQQGLHYRFSPARIAGRVLLVKGERLGLVTNGVEMRLILSDPARSDSAVSFSLDQWRSLRPTTDAPDGFLLLLALMSPQAAEKLPAILESARLKQAKVTKDLRKQAREAVEAFVQGVLDHPHNRNQLTELRADHDTTSLAQRLWDEALINVYRLLFILQGEAAGAFSFAGTSLWRNTFSPATALGPVASRVISQNVQTGRYLEEGLRRLFALFEQGIICTELKIDPLGGQLFGKSATSLLSLLAWGERGCAILLEKLLRAPQGKGKAASLVRLSYRDLDVEELGRVYEALLELEPGIAEEPMVRLRRDKLEVVVDAAQGERYRAKAGAETGEAEGGESDQERAEEQEDQRASVEWIEEIRPGQFYLRVGLGRKDSGTYYTPESFVRFLVEETLGPQVLGRSQQDATHPFEILRLNCLDPATGSGHFLVGACRFLGMKLYDACLQCAHKARQAELDALSALAKNDEAAATRYQGEAAEWWERIPAEVRPYLPGRAVEGASEVGLSAEKAQALCRRLVAINCLYGVDKNPLSVELARLSLWLVSQAEGMPLTFLDHRIIVGDSLTGPEITDLLRPPVARTYEGPDLFYDTAFREQFARSLQSALSAVATLDASIGADVTELTAKEQAKNELDRALAPFRQLSEAWTGAMMLSTSLRDDLAYLEAAKFVGTHGRLPGEEEWSNSSRAANFARMLAKGKEAMPVCYPLFFPEVFFPGGDITTAQGFDAVVGNPPWNKIMPQAKEFFASYDLDILSAPDEEKRAAIEKRLLSDSEIKLKFDQYWSGFDEYKTVIDRLTHWQNIEIEGEKSGAQPDMYRYFAERCVNFARKHGYIGLVLPSSFHANEGAAGVRQLYLTECTLLKCYSFENLQKIFEIDSRQKFATIVAIKGGSTEKFLCAFYLHDAGWLSSEKTGSQELLYTVDFVNYTGGKYGTFIELRSPQDPIIVEAAHKASSSTFAQLLNSHEINPGEEPNMTRQKKRFVSSRSIEHLLDSDDGTHKNILAAGYYLLFQGETVHQFSDRWEKPSQVVPLSNLVDRPALLEAARYYRLAWRDIASSTNERTVISTILTPGGVAGNTLPVEHKPHTRPNSIVLCIVGLINSFPFDWLARTKATTHVNKFILGSIPIPNLDVLKPFIVHCALQLICNHVGYSPLWEEQLGEEWNQGKRLIEDAARREIRTVLDAAIAHAYGLSRQHYEHVLHSFDRKSGPNPYTTLCLSKWDELHAIGEGEFVMKYDPYHHIPLVEALPLPVITLPPIAAKPTVSFTKVSRGKNASTASAVQNTLQF